MHSCSFTYTQKLRRTVLGESSHAYAALKPLLKALWDVEGDREYGEYNVWGKIALPHPISTAVITICVVLLNALQAQQRTLCIVMRSGEECHQGAVLASHEWGKFQSQGDAPS